jgi:hypothetical protein
MPLTVLFLIPLGLALAFLLWVLWNLTEQLSSRRDSAAKQPMISIRVRDPYAMRWSPPRSETAPRPARILQTETNQGSSAYRG